VCCSVLQCVAVCCSALQWDMPLIYILFNRGGHLPFGTQIVVANVYFTLLYFTLLYVALLGFTLLYSFHF